MLWPVEIHPHILDAENSSPLKQCWFIPLFTSTMNFKKTSQLGGCSKIFPINGEHSEQAICQLYSQSYSEIVSPSYWYFPYIILYILIVSPSYSETDYGFTLILLNPYLIPINKWLIMVDTPQEPSFELPNRSSASPFWMERTLQGKGRSHKSLKWYCIYMILSIWCNHVNNVF